MVSTFVFFLKITGWSQWGITFKIYLIGAFI